MQFYDEEIEITVRETSSNASSTPNLPLPYTDSSTFKYTKHW